MPQAPKQRSTEHYGQGQSGYTAGRVERDPSIGLEGRNVSYPTDADELAALDDERFVGRGSTPWAPDDTDPGKSRAKE